jgi:ribonucleoside-diphosphate reductase alpha chain
LLTGAAYKTSTELADAVGTFDAFNLNREPMLKVIDLHWDAVNNIDNSPNYLKKFAQKLWDDVRNAGSRNGFRNAQVSVLAPTGTISFMMDCDTTGIEPDIAIVKFKQLAGGGNLRIVNRTIPLALQTLGYDTTQINEIVQYVESNGFIHGAPHLLEAHLPVFDCAFPMAGSDRCISWEAHVKMMAAAQAFISGAISKTVNLPNSATAKDIADAYMLGWELGLKSIAVYRDGSKFAQPLSTTNENAKSKDNNSTPTTESRRKKRATSIPRRERLPDTRQSITHKFNVSGHEGYITVGLYPDGRVGELFITMAKEGSTIGGLMDCFGTAISMSLQYGVPLNVYIEKFSHTRFEPLGMTKNPDIPMAKSLVDYIFRWLGRTFTPEMLSVQQDPQNQNPTQNNHGTEHGHDHGQDHSHDHGHDRGHDHNESTHDRNIEQSLEYVAPPVDLGMSVENTHEQRRNVAVTSDSSKPELTSVVQARFSQHVTGQQASTLALPQISTTNRIAPHITKALVNATVAVSDTVTGTSFLTANEQYASFQSDAPLCDACGTISVRSGNCYLCRNCGKSMGCS